MYYICIANTYINVNYFTSHTEKWQGQNLLEAGILSHFTIWFDYDSVSYIINQLLV